LYFQTRIASALGFEPVIEKGVLDALPIEGGSFQLDNGSVLQSGSGSHLRASRNALRAFAIFSRADIEAACRLRLTTSEWLEVAELSDAYLRHHVSEHMPHRASDVFTQIAHQGQRKR
jgi:DNA repair protein RecO (recombination protein O)